MNDQARNTVPARFSVVATSSALDSCTANVGFIGYCRSERVGHFANLETATPRARNTAATETEGPFYLSQRTHSRTSGDVSVRLKKLLILLVLLGTRSSSPAAATTEEQWRINGFAVAFRDQRKDVLVATSDRSVGRNLTRVGTAIVNQAPRFATLLHDDDPVVRAAAAEGLRVIGPAAKGQLRDLIDLLRYTRTHGRPGLEQIEQGVLEKDDDVRSAAARAIGAMGTHARGEMPSLINLLHDSDPDLRASGLEALGAMGEAAKDQIPEAISLLHDSDWRVRLRALEALNSMGEDVQTQSEQLGEFLSDREGYLRARAADKLGEMGEAARGQTGRLVKLLSDNDGFVRQEAGGSLTLLGSVAQDQIPQLLELLNNPQARDMAAFALRGMGPLLAGYKSRFLEMLHSKNEKTRSAAVEAFSGIGTTGKDLIPVFVRLLKDPDPYIRGDAALALGRMGAAASSQIPDLVQTLKDRDPDVRMWASQAFIPLGKVGRDQAPRLVELLHDESSFVRLAAAQALASMDVAEKERALTLVALLPGSNTSVVSDEAASALRALGKAGGENAPQLIEMLTHRDPKVRERALSVLETIGPLDEEQVMSILAELYGREDLGGELRFAAHFLSGGDPATETAMEWLGHPEKRALDPIDHDSALEALHAFAKIWPLTGYYKFLREDLCTQIAIVARTGRWKYEDMPLLRVHENNLKGFGSTEAAAVTQAIGNLEASRWSWTAGKILAIHAGFWITLVFAYPRFVVVQAIFFWNPWVRRVMGLGYIGFALTWIPYLRSKLLAPFGESLRADAQLDHFEAENYFSSSQVAFGQPAKRLRIIEAIPRIQGQIVLEGESGLGKTMFLRYLVKRSNRTVVYLTAERCADGVLEAIQLKLHGPARDRIFLRNLIYAGAMDVIIDGLNEVSADTRSRIVSFAESYFKGNLILSTQPMEWKPPATAQVISLQPLEDGQIVEFLSSRQSDAGNSDALSGDSYRALCTSYVQAVLSDPVRGSESRRVLSNPMDLTVVAYMLARGQRPDVLRLQQQEYELMAAEYSRTNLGLEFPLARFSEHVYEMRLKDETSLGQGEFDNELTAMEHQRLVVVRIFPAVGGLGPKRWYFRHEKIMDFFLVQAFLGVANDRPQKHFDDARFRGTYLLLAMLLPLAEAETLERQLVIYAADSKDHSVSDSFVQLLRNRRPKGSGTQLSRDATAGSGASE